jgi:hypothetical protein
MERKALFGDKSSTFKFFMFVFLFIIWTAIGSAIAAVLGLVKGDTPGNMRLIQGISAFCMFVIPPILHFVLTRDDKPFQSLGLCSSKGIFYLISVLLIIVSMPFITQLTEWNEAMKLPESLSSLEQLIREMEEMAQAETEKMLKTDTWGGLIANLVVVALIAAVGEELTFRGVLQPWMIKVCRNPHVGIVLGAIVFSALHFQFFGFVPRFVLGLMLGYLAYASKSLWPSMLLHFINNGTAVVAMFLVERGVIDVDLDTIGSTNIYITILSALAAVALVVFVWRKREVAK